MRRCPFPNFLENLLQFDIFVVYIDVRGYRELRKLFKDEDVSKTRAIKTNGQKQECL